MTLATRALSGLASASLREDSFGLLQLSKPGLGEATLALLVAAAAVRGLLRALGATGPRSLAALGPWRGAGDEPAGAAGGHTPADAPALALQDELTTALCLLATTFGDSLRKLVAEAKVPEGAMAASRAEATKLLDRLLQADE